MIFLQHCANPIPTEKVWRYLYHFIPLSLSIRTHHKGLKTLAQNYSYHVVRKLLQVPWFPTGTTVARPGTITTRPPVHPSSSSSFNVANAFSVANGHFFAQKFRQLNGFRKFAQPTSNAHLKRSHHGSHMKFPKSRGNPQIITMVLY